MGEEVVVCVLALENGKKESNEESRTELKRDYHQCIADTVDDNTEPDQSPKKKQVKIVECGELTSTCLENSSSSDQDNKNNISTTYQNDTDTNDMNMSCVVMEIPKHASLSGIRKITFKFSKKKEDYDEEYLAKPDLEYNKSLLESNGRVQAYKNYSTKLTGMPRKHIVNLKKV